MINEINYSLTLYFITLIFERGYWLNPATLNLWMILFMANQYIKMMTKWIYWFLITLSMMGHNR